MVGHVTSKTQKRNSTTMGTGENANLEGESDPHVVLPSALPTPAPSSATAAAVTTTNTTNTKTCCAFCGENFVSRSALFRHLQRQADGCPAPRLDPGEKVMLLFGYDCCSTAAVRGKVAAVAEGEEEGAKNTAVARSTISGPSASAAIVTGGDSAGQRILEAMGINGFEERTTGVNGEGAKPVGFSQASSVGARRCPLLAQEPGVSAT